MLLRIISIATGAIIATNRTTATTTKSRYRKIYKVLNLGNKLRYKPAICYRKSESHIRKKPSMVWNFLGSGNGLSNRFNTYVSQITKAKSTKFSEHKYFQYIYKLSENKWNQMITTPTSHKTVILKTKNVRFFLASVSDYLAISKLKTCQTWL